MSKRMVRCDVCHSGGSVRFYRYKQKTECRTIGFTAPGDNTSDWHLSEEVEKCPKCDGKGMIKENE